MLLLKYCQYFFKIKDVTANHKITALVSKPQPLTISRYFIFMLALRDGRAGDTTELFNKVMLFLPLRPFPEIKCLQISYYFLHFSYSLILHLVHILSVLLRYSRTHSDNNVQNSTLGRDLIYAESC